MSACLAFGILDRITLNTTVGGTVLSLSGVAPVGTALLVLCVRFLRHGYALPNTGAGTLSIRRRRISALSHPCATAWAAGQTMTREQAIAYVLEECAVG